MANTLHGKKFTLMFYLPQFAENYYFTAQAMASGPASLQGKIIYLGGQPYMLQECSGSDVSTRKCLTHSRFVIIKSGGHLAYVVCQKL